MYMSPLPASAHRPNVCFGKVCLEMPATESFVNLSPFFNGNCFNVFVLFAYQKNQWFVRYQLKCKLRHSVIPFRCRITGVDSGATPGVLFYLEIFNMFNFFPKIFKQFFLEKCDFKHVFTSFEKVLRVRKSLICFFKRETIFPQKYIFSLKIFVFK